MSDGSVQIQPESTGKKVDTSELTRNDGSVVERQRASLADNENVESGGLAEVRDKKLQVADRSTELLERNNELLERILFLLEANLG